MLRKTESEHGGSRKKKGRVSDPAFCVYPHGMENKEEDGDSVARILVNFVPWLLLGVIFLDMAGLL